MKIHVKKTDNLVVPVIATPYSSGYDVIALEDPKIVGKLNINKNGLPDKWYSIDYIEYKTGLFISPQTDTFD